MEFKTISDKALEVRQKYSQFELKKVGHSWTNSQIMEGFVGDIGDLMKLVMAKEGSRQIDNVDEKLKHELVDSFWCILVLANKYNVNLETEFMSKMAELNQKIETDLNT